MWLYNGKEISDDDLEGYIAFVYIITNLTDNKRYIGKKNLQKIRSKKVKGKTRRKKVKSESDWREYFGSNLSLLADVERLGRDKFEREIVKLCKSKGTANYWEAYYIMANHAIMSDAFYNESLQVRVHSLHVKDFEF